jgi:hypothetical protein
MKFKKKSWHNPSLLFCTSELDAVFLLLIEIRVAEAKGKLKK